MVRNISQGMTTAFERELQPQSIRGEEMFMSRKYEALAQDIVRNVGGKQNVNDVYHCQTRLRFKLADEEKADKDA